MNFLVTIEKGVPWSFCYAGRGSNKEVAIADRFKEKITMLVCGSVEMSVEIANDYVRAVGLESTDD